MLWIGGAFLALVAVMLIGCGRARERQPGGSGSECEADDECRGRCVALSADRRVCADECGDAGDCPEGWVCGGGVCGCTPGPEDCNSSDDDCDGDVDEGLQMCGAVCVDTLSDTAHCGTCGNVCAESESCVEGVCCTVSAETCNSEDDDCDGRVDEGVQSCGSACVVLATDPVHCGACGNACAPGQECRDGSCCTPVVRDELGELDILFMVDNSNSMTEEQASLAEQLPRMLRVLASGDLNGDGTSDFDPPSSVQVGVVSSDMGTGGFTVPTCAEPDLGDDGILRTEGNTLITGCMATYPSFLTFSPGSGDDPAEFAQAFDCVARMGTGGCGFEQQLEAVLKAVTPSTSPTRFSMDTTGHADGANAGFLRSDAILAVVLLTDEEDCSVSDPELFNPTSGVYGGNLNLRCFSYPDAVHPIRRYVDGLIAVKEEPARIVYGLIAGVPPDLVAEGASYDEILADDRMQERIDDGDPIRLEPSCSVVARGVAFPPRRMVQVAQGLEGAGAFATVQSICQADFTPAVNAILATIAESGSVEECVGASPGP